MFKTLSLTGDSYNLSGSKRFTSYFLMSRKQAYRQKFGEYSDIVRAKRKRKDVTHEEMKRKVMEVLGISNGSFGRFDKIAEDDPIEIETRSNRNDQIYENIKKSVEEFGFARFVVADEVTYDAVLQQAARYRFKRKYQTKPNNPLTDLLEVISKKLREFNLYTLI